MALEKLDDNYEIDGTNMVDFEPGDYGDYKLDEAEFYSFIKEDHLKIKIIQKGDYESEFQNQVFKMKDGSYILESEFEEDIEYYISNDLQEILNF